jgi:hypothetical protein
VWSISYVYGVGSTTLGGIPAVEAAAEESANGIEVSWATLTEFAGEVDDLFDGLFVAYDSSLPPAIKAGSFDVDCVMALQLHDSSFWQCLFRCESHAEYVIANTEFAVRQPKDGLLIPWIR